ncbi:MAG: type transport system ATP-binding protein [Thermotogaceae bacterium]|jgi:ABC-2 type transport system ATP-binding protein|nr:type transport system ATP-binding protein [Thermotogaceae bacterium]MDN5337293.1 type transport system ATP-binding protein [Thermotogaceae bacterium]
MITLENVTKIYSGTTRAVENLTLTVENGEIFGFLGPNGAGKTTTIKMIVGLLKPTEGTVKINDIDINLYPEKAKKMIGYVADEPLVMEKLRGIDYLKFIADVFEVPYELRTKRIGELLESFKLTSSITDPISTYSHGMRQKLTLIAALLHEPDVWILDEPIIGLDPESAYILKKLMRKHADSGKTVFFSTHVMEIAEKLCDRIGIINRGKLLYVGTLDELKKLKGSGSLEELFLELTGSNLPQLEALSREL